MNIETGMFPVKAQISPQSVAAAGTASSAWVDTRAGVARRVGVIGLVGTIGATVDFKLEQATSAAGAGVKDLKAGTQILATADDTALAFDAALSLMDAENSFYFVRVTATAGAGTAALLSAAMIFIHPDFVA